MYVTHGCHICEWSRKYGEEYQNTTGNKENSGAKEMRKLNLKIKELEKSDALKISIIKLFCLINRKFRVFCY